MPRQKSSRHRAAGEVFLLTSPLIGPPLPTILFPSNDLAICRGGKRRQQEPQGWHQWLEGTEYTKDYAPCLRVQELKVRGLECRRNDTSPLLKRMQCEVLAILAEEHDCDSYLHKIEAARMVLTGYEERLSDRDVDIRDLIVSKRITREPRDYQKPVSPRLRLSNFSATA